MRTNSWFLIISISCLIRCKHYVLDLLANHLFFCKAMYVVVMVSVGWLQVSCNSMKPLLLEFVNLPSGYFDGSGCFWLVKTLIYDFHLLPPHDHGSQHFFIALLHITNIGCVLNRRQLFGYLADLLFYLNRWCFCVMLPSNESGTKTSNWLEEILLVL